ncbi:MAG: hypothetical protein E6Q97_35710 [Desulfurellales bacterium]|nr:MAG: hypothetical protein E6Q97_35710 [Desulfurellales bacterium]
MARPYIYITIEAYGAGNSPYRFCETAPPGSTTPSLYKDLLTEFPRQLSESVKITGGVADSGELTVELLDSNIDGVVDWLTSLFRWLRKPANWLLYDISATDTEVYFQSNTGLGVDVEIFIGGEKLIITSFAFGTTWNVSRGRCETLAQRHGAGDPVLLSSPALYGRRMRFWLAMDNDDAPEEIGGGWAIDGIKFIDALNTWALTGKSQLKYLDRVLDRRPTIGTLNGFAPDQSSILYRFAGPYNRHFQDRYFIQIGDSADSEIVEVTVEDVWTIVTHGVAGTRQRDYNIGDTIRQVWTAHGAYGSFRRQDPGAESSSRDPADWIVDPSAVNILLNLATGKSDIFDFVPDNYTAGKGNYSGLPSGVGIGVRAAELDFDSFLDVWYRAQNVILDGFALTESKPARAVFNNILQLTGFDLTIVNGKLYLGWTRLPLEDEITAAWGVDEILAEEESENVFVPRVECSIDTDISAGAIVFTCRATNGTDVEIVYTAADFPEVFGDAAGLFEVDEKRFTIDARAVIVDLSGSEPEFLRQHALKLLYLIHRPLQRISLYTDLEQRSVQHSDLIAFTYSQIRNLETGTTGVTDLICKIVSKAVDFSEGEIHWEMIAIPGGRQGRIAPSARISSVASNTATVAANRYTETGARGGLPTSDAASFAPGDRVCLQNRAGQTFVTTPAYQTVSSVGTNTITLDGNFGGAAEFSAGYLLQFVNRDDQVLSQYSKFVSLADSTDRTVGSSTQTPWTVGEP